MPPDAHTQIFEAHRPRLVRLAYRMLGSLAEAEDVAQDAWIRWNRAEGEEIRAPAGFLTRIVTRLCLDRMKSARARRESYVGNWLPEPLVEPPDEDMRADEITLTLMLALERLSPLERAAFLLHDVFGQPLESIAETLAREPAAVRQLAVRARQHVRAAKPRYHVAPQDGARIAQAFFAASTGGDLDTLRSMLADDVVVRADGGGNVSAFLNPVFGLDKVLRLFDGLYRKLKAGPAVWVRPARIDGLPGYISRERDGVLQTTALEIEGGRIRAIYITRNPDKLATVRALTDGGAGGA